MNLRNLCVCVEFFCSYLYSIQKRRSVHYYSTSTPVIETFVLRCMRSRTPPRAVGQKDKTTKVFFRYTNIYDEKYDSVLTGYILDTRMTLPREKKYIGHKYFKKRRLYLIL